MLNSRFGTHHRLTFRRAGLPAMGILALLALTPAAPAQSASSSSSEFKEEKYEISPYVGGTFYHGVSSGLGSHLMAGPTFGVHLTENFWQHFGFEESVGYNRNQMELLTPIGTNSAFSQRFEDRALNFNVDGVYYFTKRGSRVRPFVYAGAGGVRFRPTKEAVSYFQQNFSAPSGAVLRGETRGQYNFGGGLKLRINDWFAVRGDVKGLVSRNPTLGMSPLPSAGAYIPNGDWVKAAEVTGALVFELVGKSEPNAITVTPIVATPSQGDGGLTAANPAAAGTGFRLCETAHDTLGHTLNYHWTVNGMPVGENSNCIMYTPAQPGQYKVEVQVSDASTKRPATPASPEPITLYVIEHRITVGAITIAPLQGTAGLSANDPAANGSGFRFSTSAQDTMGHSLTYRWTVDGNTIPGNTNSVTFTESQAGQHRVEVQATDGTLTASAANPAFFYTADRSRPTATCNASPGAVTIGQSVNLSVNLTVAQGSASHVRWTVSEGSVANATAAQTTYESSAVAFPTSGQVQTKTITATATVTDDFGGSVSCNSTFTVSTNPQTVHYGDIVFGQGSARINNCAKRVLIERVYPQLTGSYQDYTLVLVGHIDPSEKASRTLDRSRVMNAAAVLTAGKDTCMALEPSRITADWVATNETEFKDTPCSVSFEAAPAERPADRVNANDERAKNRRVEIWLVPPGKSLPSSVKEAHPIPLPELKRLACPK